jgi:peptidoglycan/LPS O-acetylase OafA/YrhL
MSESRYKVLDGWRGISILLVLSAHLLPLGPKSLKLNHLAGVSGMAVFFVLSGFLIANQLAGGMPVKSFLIRRFFRIAPLAWLGLLLLLVTGAIQSEAFLRLASFSANLPPQTLNDYTAHYWSLCVEVQFYVFAALLVALLGVKGLWGCVLGAIAVTLYRIDSQAWVDIQTLRRVDEIFAGAILALLIRHDLPRLRHLMFGVVPWWCVMPVFLLSCHPAGQEFNYLRPYLAMWVIGSTLHGGFGRMARLLESSPVLYLATTSYALYVVHGILMGSWLGVGDTTLEKYLKRPLLFAATFALAHWSTKYFEAYFIKLGKRLSSSAKPSA